MRPHSSTSALFVVSSLFCFGSSLPFFRGEISWLEPLVKRVPYSVVLVDGGSASTATTPDAPSTVIATITKTSVPETKTIVETDNITIQTVTTDHKISTQTVNGPETTKTLVVTVFPSVSYLVIDVSPPTSTEAVESTIMGALSTPSPKSPSTAASSTPVATTGTSTSTSSAVSSPVPMALAPPQDITSTSTSVTPTRQQTSAVPVSSSYVSSFTTSMETSIITSKPAASTSTSTTKTYDDGQWHTSYPPWSNGTATTTQPSLPSMTASSSTAAGDRLATRVSGLFTRAVMVGERVLKALVFFRN